MRLSVTCPRPPSQPVTTHTSRLTGAFVDRGLEAAFLTDNFELSTKRLTRFSITLSALSFLAYGINDAYVIPSVHVTAWAIRYGIFAPVAAVVLMVVFSRRLFHWHQPLMLAFGMALNLVVIWIGAISPPAGYFLYTSYAVMFVTLGPFVARMNVPTQLAYTLLSVALLNAFDLAIAHATLAVLFSMNLTLASLGAIGALVAHQLEGQARRSFLQRRVIRDQLAELDIEKDKTDLLLLNVLPADIATRLKAADDAIADGFDDVTVLFLDIVGFTPLSARLTPEELVGRLNEIFSRFDDLTEELEVEKIKTIGDAYMVVGGLSTHTHDHAPVMAEMALRMQAVVRELAEKFGEKLDVRIGMNTGPVVAGVIGKKKFSYDVWGDTVNTASRMESHSTPGRIQVTEATFARLSGTHTLECRGEVVIKGKGPMITYFLLGRDGARETRDVDVASSVRR